MAIVRMKKLSVIGMQSERQSILRELMALGVLEVSDNTAKLQDEEWQALVSGDGDEATASEMDRKLTRVQQALSILERYGRVKRPAFSTRRAVTEAELAKYREEMGRFEEETDEITALYDAYTHAQNSENAANAQIFALAPWESYDLPLEMKETGRLRLALGVFPPVADLERIGEDLEYDGCSAELREISRDKEQIYARLWYFREDEPRVLETVKSAGFAKPAFAYSPGTVSENISECRADIEVLLRKKEELLGQIADKAAYIEDLELYHDILVISRDEARVRSNLVNTSRAFEFDGYVPEAAVGEVEAVLDRYFCNYEFTEPEDGDDVPVRLSNRSFFSPIEFITKMYSLPSYREIDPTSIFTFFYIIFFGIMFGDVGYGILLILGSVLAVRKFHMNEGGAGKLMRVIFYSGISSVFWGFMFGSFFGDLIPVVSETFFGSRVPFDPVWLDPAKEPMLFLAFSCACGVIHLFVGMGIKAYEEIKDGRPLEACNDVFVWYIIILGLVMWLFGGMVSEALVPIGKVLSIAGFALALILPVFIAKGVGKALGIWNIYSGVTGNLSDILSYSRLLGLGLASTSIAQVFNFLASMGGKSVVGIVMFVLIFLVGHALNFAINALGAFVHSCRLQYVEFFGKFYEGGGREFEPFSRSTKYINIIEGGK